MSEPVVFISHFAIKEGALDDLRRHSVEGVARIREEKPPQTALGLRSIRSRRSLERPARSPNRAGLSPVFHRVELSSIIWNKPRGWSVPSGHGHHLPSWTDLGTSAQEDGCFRR